LCATLGSCVHIAGIFNFMRLARHQGYNTEFLRPPNTINEIFQKIKEIDPYIIALSYRLTPEAAIDLIKELQSQLTPELKEKKWIFGGTTPVCEAIKPLGVFTYFFGGETTEQEVLSYLRRTRSSKVEEEVFPNNLIDRIELSKPFPLLRAHFGLPSVETTIKGIEEIARAKVLDIISIGPDQNFQENYFRPNDNKMLEKGAGGVPIRSEEDLLDFYKASQLGNYPLLRCYSGTRDLIKMAELLQKAINNAWGATPLFWYSELDGRSSRVLSDAIRENQQNMAWHGKRTMPFESNEAHHWSLRSAPDSVAVAAAFLGAYNAKKAGVKDYISQMMLDTPLNISPRFDLAKMKAKTELIENLHDTNFTSYRQVRAGLFSFPEDLDQAKGQLSSSLQMAMFLDPHIVHVVSYCEASHVATSKEIIESAKIAYKIISNSIRGLPSISQDQKLISYKHQLTTDANYILQAICSIASDDVENPLTDPITLSRAVKIGILDAPHLRGSTAARGEIETSIEEGKCLTIDKYTLTPISEKERLLQILEREGFSFKQFNCNEELGSQRVSS
ncbi:MAG: methionine synthase, partial [Candidatus Hodarchaeales archaeon]